MATALLEHVLANQLAQGELAAVNAPRLAVVLEQQRTVQLAEHAEGLNGPVLHRWQLRLTSLVAATNPQHVRAAGFRLLLVSFAASDTLLFHAGKNALQAAQSVLASPKSDPALVLSALDLARLILAKSTWHPEWARENVGAQTVQKLIGRLVEIASAEGSEVTLPCVAAIISLIPLYPTALRPLAPSFHNLAVSLLSDSSSPALSDAGAQLFVSLYLLAPKGKEGLREAWRTGVEALIGSVDQLATHVVNGIFAEDTTFNHTLSPLAMPPLPTADPVDALARLEVLAKVLLLALRTPTTEKAGPVSVPLGALVELGVRLTSFSTATPVKERTDPTLRTATYALLPRLQVQGCQLLAQIALSAASHLATHATTILSALAKTLTTYEVRSPMRPAISTAYAVVLQGLGGSVDPEEGKKSLARVWRTVLEDIGAVALEPVVVAQSSADTGKNGSGGGTGSGGNSRRAKRQRMYDPSESMAQRRVAVDEADLEIARRGLATLERLMRCPHAHFLPPTLQLATSRMLLYLSLSPSFFLSHPLASTSTSFYPSTSAYHALDIARQSPAFRRTVVSALQTALEQSFGGVGLEEKAVEVWRRAANDSDDQVRLVALQGLAHFGTVAHPVVPPQQPNSAFTRVRHEQKGGFVGDEEDLAETAEMFRLRVEPEREASEDDEERMEVEERLATAAAAEAEEGERRRKVAAANAPTFATSANPTFSPSSFAQPPSAAASTSFSSFAAPTFGSSAPVAAPLSGAASAEAAPVSVADEAQPIAPVKAVDPATFIEASTEKAAASKASPVEAEERPAVATAAADGDSDDEDDDDEMPAIDLGSDDE